MASPEADRLHFSESVEWVDLRFSRSPTVLGVSLDDEIVGHRSMTAPDLTAETY